MRRFLPYQQHQRSPFAFILSNSFLRQHYLRETGATTKDDLSVVLGEFDLSSESDTFDTKRQTLVEAQTLRPHFLHHRQEERAAGDRPDRARELSKPAAVLQRHCVAQTR